jgi:hypothetical protein
MQAAGVPGTAATWVALTGMPAGCGCTSAPERGQRVYAGPESGGFAFFWGAGGEGGGGGGWWAPLQKKDKKPLLARKAESRRAADTSAEASCRSHASGALVLEASTQTAGLPGTAATWVAPTGTPAARALGCGGRASCGCVETACARSPRGPGPCFFGGGALIRPKSAAPAVNCQVSAIEFTPA